MRGHRVNVTLTPERHAQLEGLRGSAGAATFLAHLLDVYCDAVEAGRIEDWMRPPGVRAKSMRG